MTKTSDRKKSICLSVCMVNRKIKYVFRTKTANAGSHSSSQHFNCCVLIYFQETRGVNETSCCCRPCQNREHFRQS